jgi:hypothetical protein
MTRWMAVLVMAVMAVMAMVGPWSARPGAASPPAGADAAALGFASEPETAESQPAPPPAFAPAALVSPLALALEDPAAGQPRGRSMLGKRRHQGGALGLDPERARILLQSLTVPGWGQASLGRRTSATVFALADVGVWGSFTAFRIQEQLRRRSYEVTARLFAGIDLAGRDEEFRRIVGSFPSSEDYNRLVVARDAANLYYDDPERYRAYIAEHELAGADAWAWDSEEHYLRYGDERKRTQRAALRANATLALAIANRLVSAIHAARYAGRPAPSPRGWNLECVPAPNDPTAFHLGVRARF